MRPAIEMRGKSGLNDRLRGILERYAFNTQYTMRFKLFYAIESLS